MQTVVAVDIGNSSIKLAVDPKAVVVVVDASLPDEGRAQLISDATRDVGSRSQWLVCSVDKVQTEWLEAWVLTNRPNDSFHLVAANEISLASHVRDREALGRDRLLASWYAADQAGDGANAIVVDAGTAVTIDVVLRNEHLGGLIFPGTATCLSAVSSQTDALPDLAQQPAPELRTEVSLGLSTEPAILLGVHQLQLFGIVSMVRSLEQQYPDAVVYCCGGAFASVHALLPESWSYRQHFLIDAIFRLKQSL
ncbi:type III pantothenate kinase [Mariniblastus fucicola]|uniref:Type III pantothenate kinase n=1 Tax=Mariniblastus fucicola TaxID=980251 RepID=A0A5B9P991_9BACT|nr:type III pantothenate kinase [Mariniblastus fucicola]QEG21206.1 Type III pantothenate kinase [Mariniblastus fucicola]